MKSQTFIIEPHSYRPVNFIHYHHSHSQEDVRYRFEEKIELSALNPVVDDVIESKEVEADKNYEAVTDCHHRQAHCVEK